MSGFPVFCDSCRNILNEIEDGGVRYCRHCQKNQLIGNNRLLATVFYDQVAQKLPLDSVLRVATERTTQRIEKNCENCDSTIMAVVMDSDYFTHLVCLKCSSVFS